MVDKNILKSFIELNIVKDFIVFTNAKENFEALRDSLVELRYHSNMGALTDGQTLSEGMTNFAVQSNYNCAWRISHKDGIIWNKLSSIEWWKSRLSHIYPDMIELDNDECRYLGDDIMNCSLSGLIPVVLNGKVIGVYFCNLNNIGG